MNDTGINTRADWQGEGTLSQLSGELRARQASRIDCTVDPRQLLVNVANTGELLLASVPGTQASEFISTEGVIIRDKAVTQLCTRMNPDVPARFGKSLATMRPNIAVDMFNSLISQDDYSKSRRWFVRQLRGQVRAILSDRYLAIDDEDLMFTALQELQNHGGWVMSAQLTDDNMRMSYCCPSLGRLLDSPARGDGSFFDAGSMANPQWLNRMGINEKSWPDQFKMLKDANGYPAARSVTAKPETVPHTFDSRRTTVSVSMDARSKPYIACDTWARNLNPVSGKQTRLPTTISCARR